MLNNEAHKATVFDVAKLAGVSIKTVSRVVNREPHVSVATQQRVDHAISTLHYVPSEAARMLAGHRIPKSP
jgi:LacI family transcriptional regulator